MANCLMQINQCGFASCGQHFANQYDLTSHIEYTHIPMLEEEVKKKAKAAAAAAINGEGVTQPVANNLPLSYYSRVFRSAYRPNPIKPEPLKVSFNHYKKRALREKQVPPHHLIHRAYREMMARQGRPMSLEEVEKRLMDVDFEECGPDNNEVRYRCHIVDCNKRYKNMFALRMHMKVSHAVVVSEDAKSLTNFPSEDVKPSLPLPHSQLIQANTSMENNSSSSQQTGLTNAPNTLVSAGSPMMAVVQPFGNPATTPTSYKCSYCSKRYKTSSGLSNHMMQSHQKISDVHDAPSPQVLEQLISQARMQRQQQEQSGSDQQGRTMQSSGGTSQLPNNSHVRSYTVTTAPPPLRFNQQHYPVNLDNQPSTGQVLQMQMQHQRRMKQMQEQQAAAAAAAAAASAQQQQQAQPQQAHQQQQVQSQPTQHQHQQMHQPQSHGMPVGQIQQSYAPSPMPPSQIMGPPMAPNQQMQPPQTPGPSGHSQAQHQMGSMQPPPQQYHQMPPPSQPQPYPQQMHHHQMVPQGYQGAHHYQPQYPQHQQSTQHPPYQHQSPQQGGPPQRSPIPLSQALPPLNSVMPSPRPPQMQQMSIPQPNSVPMHMSPPNSHGYGMMSSPQTGSQMPPPPPPYNM